MANGLEKIKERLSKTVKIEFTRHATLRYSEREITQKEIENHIRIHHCFRKPFHRNLIWQMRRNTDYASD